MKKQILLLLLGCSLIQFSSGQIICVQCFNQNDSLSFGVNNLILNGGFENTTCLPNGNIYCPNSSGYVCDILNWTCIDGGTNTYSMLYDSSWTRIVEGTKAAYFGNAEANACSISSFDTACLINSGCSVIGIPIGYPLSQPSHGGTLGVSLEQTISGLTIGNTYVLEFWAGGEALSPTMKRGIFAVDIGFGKTYLRCNSTPALQYGGGIGVRYIIEFNATNTSHTIKFTNWGHIANLSTNELILDDVKLYTIAELPQTVSNCSVGINEINKNEIEIYPNPLTSELTVTTGQKEQSQIILYDLSSRKLLQQTFTNTITINTEQLAKGMYLYTVRNRNGIIKNGKVIKQ